MHKPITRHKPIVAAFDFDGTLTYRDTLLPFLCFGNNPVHIYAKVGLKLPKLFRFSLGLASRQDAKEAVLALLKDMPYDRLCRKGVKFADAPLNKLLNPKAIHRLKWHQGHGHRCILVSANLDVYLHPWAKKMGFHDVITSQCAVSENGLFTGALLGANCWGPEKARRLQELLGPRDAYTLYAYGDSKGDKEMLALADFPCFRTFG